MSLTIEKRQPISMPKITRREWHERLKAARAHERMLKEQNQPRPNPTKDWSRESWESVSEALSSAQS
jgi:hypothetical protein